MAKTVWPPEVKLPVFRHMEAGAALSAAQAAWDSVTVLLHDAKRLRRSAAMIRCLERAEVRAARRFHALRRILGR